MIVFSWTSIAFASFEFFFTILASLSIFSIVVTCIFYVGKRELYFNLCNSSNDNALQWVLVSYDLLLLYQILRLTSNCNHMRLIISFRHPTRFVLLLNFMIYFQRLFPYEMVVELAGWWTLHFLKPQLAQEKKQKVF